MSDLWQTVASVGSVVLGGAGITSLVATVMQRRSLRADVMMRVNETTLAWAAQVRDDAQAEVAAARADEAAARSEANQVRRDINTELIAVEGRLRSVRDEAEALALRLHRLIWAIWEPGTTVDGLRQMVPHPGSRNGGSP